MTSPAMKLDTLAYAKRLIAAGCTPQLAEAHASAQQDVLVEISEDHFSQFATKHDLDAHRIATKQDLDAHRIATKQDLDNHRVATKQDLDAHRIATKQDLEAHRIETKNDIDALRIATKHDLEAHRIETKNDIDALRIATKQDLLMLEQKIEQKMTSLALKMTTILGGLVVAGVIVLAAIIKL